MILYDPINVEIRINIEEYGSPDELPPEEQQLIEKAVQASDLGLNPQNDGNLIRLPIPALTEERRKELYKNCKKISEESKIAIRNIRRDSNEKLKKAEKDKGITQDEQKISLDDIQKVTDTLCFEPGVIL